MTSQKQMLIFDLSRRGRGNPGQAPLVDADISDIPRQFLRDKPPLLPEVSALDAVRHYTRLSQKNFSIDTHFFPLGSCTMKHNPRAGNLLAMLPQFLERHPLSPEDTGQGYLACLFELQEILKELTGMAGVSLTPMAGAQAEFAGIAMIRAYHEARGDHSRTEVLIPDSAHGTNPASAAMCGYQVKEIPTDSEGNVDRVALKAVLGPRTAALMLTNPSTLGVFEQAILEIEEAAHKAGALLYCDGANLNAILGKIRPRDMGFDVIHVNLHKTFSTPHGSGGPGAGPIGVSEALLPFLPTPVVGYDKGIYYWMDDADFPRTIGRLSAFMGNAGVLLRAYVYARMLGTKGMQRVSEFAALNANYLMVRLKEAGFEVELPQRRAGHEFVVTLKTVKEKTGVSAMDVAKRLLDKGFYAPTVYFPQLVPECLLIEPTETESKQTLDTFVAAMKEILDEAKTQPDLVKQAPHTMPVKRLDEVKAARELDLTWQPAASTG